MLLAHHHILTRAPPIEVPPEADVRVMGIGVAVAILLPEELQRCVPVGGEFAADLGKVRQRLFRWGRNRFQAASEQGLFEFCFVAVVSQRPSEAGLLEATEVIVNGAFGLAGHFGRSAAVAVATRSAGGARR